ncbi:MAG: class IIb bacteriocin, lactobin A/cerein 7B family [Flavobacteriaceae bacterium]|jgi:lactobin A/cerein 7B family class IIb bacteriocin|nr:class IIb bacteriocin, lactobin A/cerein 7B family [Flavobacteriaceae bacterium]
MNLEKLNLQELSVEELVNTEGGMYPLAIAIAVGAYFILGTGFCR